MKPGMIVCSISGRDKGCYMMITKVNDKRVLVADGKKRRLDNPKPKNQKHLIATDTSLDIEKVSTNKLLTRALKNYITQADSREEQ